MPRNWVSRVLLIALPLTCCAPWPHRLPSLVEPLSQSRVVGLVALTGLCQPECLQFLGWKEVPWCPLGRSFAKLRFGMLSLPALFEGDCLIPTRSHPQGGPLQTPVTHLQSEGQAGRSCGSWRPVEPTGPRAHAERELVSTTGSYKSQGWDKVGLSAALREKAQPVCSGEVTRGDPEPCSGALMSAPSGAILNH